MAERLQHTYVRYCILPVPAVAPIYTRTYTTDVYVFFHSIHLLATSVTLWQGWQSGSLQHTTRTLEPRAAIYNYLIRCLDDGAVRIVPCMRYQLLFRAPPPLSPSLSLSLSLSLAVEIATYRTRSASFWQTPMKTLSKLPRKYSVDCVGILQYPIKSNGHIFHRPYSADCHGCKSGSERHLHMYVSRSPTNCLKSWSPSLTISSACHSF